MAELDDALTTLASWLEGEHVPYMVIGGFAVTVWGEPRFTRDLDVTVSVPADRLPSTIDRICDKFTPLVTDPKKFVNDTRVLPMMVQSTPVDLIFAALPYEEAAITRARQITLTSGSVRICSPEDLILYKLWYYRISRQTRHPRDIYSILHAQEDLIDLNYIRGWVDRLGLSSVWDELLRNRPDRS